MWDEMSNRLDSAIAVRNVTAPGRHLVGETLYLMVWPSGTKSWVQRLRIGGKRKDLGLGPYPAITLAQARDKAHGNLALTKSGGNPLADREAAATTAVPAFEDLARRHIAENAHAWRNAKHGAQWLSTLETYAFPTLGALRVDEVTRRHVWRCYRPSGRPSRRRRANASAPS